MTLHDDKAFYDRCAELLGVEHDFQPFRYGKRSRWNNRKPGSGRFPGRGLVRVFGNHVHLSLYRPKPINRLFDSREAALQCLEELSASASFSSVIPAKAGTQSNGRSGSRLSPG